MLKLLKKCVIFITLAGSSIAFSQNYPTDKSSTAPGGTNPAKLGLPLPPEEFAKNVTKTATDQDADFQKWLEKRIAAMPKSPGAAKQGGAALPPPTPMPTSTTTKTPSQSSPGAAVPVNPYAPTPAGGADSNISTFKSNVTPITETQQAAQQPVPQTGPSSTPSSQSSQVYTGFPSGGARTQPSNQNKSSGWHIKY